MNESNDSSNEKRPIEFVQSAKHKTQKTTEYRNVNQKKKKGN